MSLIMTKSTCVSEIIMPTTPMIPQYRLHSCEITRHWYLGYWMYLVLWSVIVFNSQGDMESLIKSLMQVLIAVNTATMPHLYQVFNTMCMNRVFSEGPIHIYWPPNSPIS